MFNFTRFLLTSFLLCSGSAFANNYFWVGSGYSQFGQFSSPSLACTVIGNSTWSDEHSYTAKLKSDGFFNCFRNGDFVFEIIRFGDFCPDGEEYNSELGQCLPPEEPEEPPHQCEAGDVIGPYKYPGTLSGGYVIPNPPAPYSACKNGCEYSRKGKSDGCQSGIFGTFCSYSFVGTGADCTAAPDNDMGGDSGEGPNANDGGDGGEGAGDGGDGSGDGGSDDGGDGDDNTSDDFPEAPEESTAEGDAKESTLQEIKSVLGTLSKEDTAKKTEKNTKGISDKVDKGNGLLGDILQAINDKPVGGGGGSNNGDGDGEGDESTVTGGDACDSPPVCTGDAVQCAILAQEFKRRCDAEDLNDFEKHKDKIDTLLEGDNFELNDTEVVEVESFIAGQARWLPSTCPSDEQMSLRLNGGRTFSLSYEPLCSAAGSLSPLIVIIATLMATLYVGRGSGG